MITVYGLTDEYGQVRYVGQTGEPLERFHNHRSAKLPFTLSGMAILERVRNRVQANAAEYRWITFFGQDTLLNKSDVGHVASRTKNMAIVKIRLSAAHHAHLAWRAAEQGHGNKAIILRQLIEQDMRARAKRPHHKPHAA